MKYQLNGREVEVDGIDGTDVDAFVEKAYYVDTGIELTEDELNRLPDENPEAFADDLFQNAICAAEAYFEGDR